LIIVSAGSANVLPELRRQPFILRCNDAKGCGPRNADERLTPELRAVAGAGHARETSSSELAETMIKADLTDFVFVFRRR